MSVRERIRPVLREWEVLGPPPAKPRRVDHRVLKLPHIVDVVGVRRAGKTYLLYYWAKRLMDEGENVIYLNFEDRRLHPLDWDLIEEVERQALLKGRTYLMLDEVQEFPEWGRWARSLYDRRREVKLIVTGSTSRILQPEISSLLTGRHVTLKLFPLSFLEFITFKEVQPKGLPEEESLLMNLFDEYLRWGAFPEVTLLAEKGLLLRSYYEDILYRDLVGRFRIREVQIMENFLKYLLTNVGRPFSIRRAKNFLASYGISASTRTILRYTGMLEEIFLFFFVQAYGKVKDALRHPRKAYTVDLGLKRVATTKEDRGAELENLMFLHFKRNGEEIRYWKGDKGEVDLLVMGKYAVQVTWELTSDNERRELAPLVECAKREGVKPLLVTYEQEDVIEREGMKIRVIPAYKLLLKGHDVLKGGVG
ncbi:MAG: ATP-binding protein [Candidatus Korarchaeota archaeon]|nr:ATP-binding protein [Candidatus Korarchaeota archaeon]